MMKVIRFILIQIIYISIFLFILLEAQSQSFYFKGNEFSEILKSASFYFTRSPMAQVRLFIFYSLFFTIVSIGMLMELSDESGLDNFIICRYQSKKRYIEYKFKRIVRKSIEQFIIIFISVFLASLFFMILTGDYKFSIISFIMIIIFSIKFMFVYSFMSILAKMLLIRLNVNIITVVILTLYIIIMMLDINFGVLDLLFFSDSMIGMIQGIIGLIVCSTIYYQVLNYRKEII